jgi:lysozyme
MRTAKARALIKSFEDCKLKAYQDSGGVWTIGYGATGPKIGPGLIWSQDRAESDLLQRLLAIDTGLTKLQSKDTVRLTDCQAAALLSFIYELGLEALARSTMWDMIKQKDILNAAMEFPKWSKVREGAQMVRVKGVLRRRMMEGYHFLTED